MRLPRRVPWASLSELEQVCSWIYADETDTEAKVHAVNRLAAWRATTALPHALESALALLTAILADHAHQGSTSYLSLRLSYSTAIIRLVNGLVDPLQLGAYARSIASIAAQLGLPAWWIELRHAATHEDLPSIEVLREAAREAMGWLLNNYFLPTLNSSAPPTANKTPLRPLSPLLKQYKTLLKATTRDVSLVSRYQPETTKALREIERWLAEAKVAAGNVVALEWDSDGRGDSSDEGDGREKWALEKLCDALLERGALVPISKKKRTLSGSSFNPLSAVVRIWSPLLTQLQDLYPSFAVTLVSKIISRLLSFPQSPAASPGFGSDTVMLGAQEPKLDMSYDRCLAAWANWLVNTWGSSAEDLGDNLELKREDIVIALVRAMGPGKDDASQRNGARELLSALCSGHPNLERASTSLISLKGSPSAQWQEQDLHGMHERLESLLALFGDRNLAKSATGTVSTDAPSNMDSSREWPPGWRLAGEREGWRPCPLGVFVGSI